MLILITGPAQSGKTTTVERLIRTALQEPWSHVLIVSGNAGQMFQSDGDGRIRAAHSGDPEAVAQALSEFAARTVARCAARPAKGAPDTRGRELLVVDDFQAFTRNAPVSTMARSALTRIAEHAAGLSDVVIVSAQRATGTIPPGARTNVAAELRMLGGGQFQLVAQGQPPRTGRVAAGATLGPATNLDPGRLPAALAGPDAPRPPTLVTRYEGPSGSGRTHALRRHQPTVPGLRRVELDVEALSHKTLLVSCLEQCGAAPPEGVRIGIPDLLEAATVALEAHPTLLLLDNTDRITPRLADTLGRLIDAASEAAITLRLPPRNAVRDNAATLRRRSALVELRPLAEEQAEALVHQVAPTIDPASARAVIQHADGNPQAIIAFTERVATHGAEERHRLESTRPPSRWLNILLMFAVLVAVILIQRTVAHDVAGAVLSALVIVTMWFIRPRFRTMLGS